jgi:hypothetical protein
MIVPLLGSVLLILLAAAKASPRLRRMPRWYAWLLPLVVWLAGVNLWMPLSKSYSDSPAPGLVLQAVRKLDGQALTGIQYIFIVEGSSVTWNGFDGNRVQSLLNQHGIPALVIQLSAAGANHAERFEYLKEFVAALRPDQIEGLRTAKVVLCREVELGYDKNPVNNLLRNGSTGRSLRYLGPANLPVVFSWLALKYRPIDWIREHTVLAELAGCGLFNLFHIGYLPRVEDLTAPAKVEPFVPNTTQSPGFAPNGDLYPPKDIALDKKETSVFVANLPWQKKRDDDFRGVFGGLAPEQCFFAFPSWSRPNACYNIWKSRQHTKFLFFDGEGTPLEEKLNIPSLWYDVLHLQLPGAEIYSEEFAEYLVEKIQAKDL